VRKTGGLLFEPGGLSPIARLARTEETRFQKDQNARPDSGTADPLSESTAAATTVSYVLHCFLLRGGEKDRGERVWC
jgi:hypothetical protein